MVYTHSMAYDEFTVDRVRQTLPSDLDVREIRMMGGLIFMVNGNMCCGVADQDLMVRVGPAAYDAALSEPHVDPLEIGGGRKPRAFVRVKAEAIASDTQLARWLSRGLEFVSTLPSKATGQR